MRETERTRTCVLTVNSSISQIQMLGTPEVVMGHLWWFLSVGWIGKTQSQRSNESVNPIKSHINIKPFHVYSTFIISSYRLVAAL